jgi:signal transduction histidine kinase
MLNSGKEARLFGFSYPVIFTTLSIAGAATTALLLSLASATTSLESSRRWITSLTALLGCLFAAAVWVARWYLSATKHLADVRTTSKAVLESLVGGVLTFDNEGRFQIVNRAAARMLDLPAHAPYPTFDSFGTRHPSIAQAVKRALSQEEYVQDSDTAFIDSAGKSVILRTTVSAQLNEDGERVGLIVLVKDVSAIVALQQELRKRDRLAAAGSLAAGVAHEIRNPLSAIDLNLRLLKSEVAAVLPGRQDVVEYFEILFVEIARLNRITASFLQLSRPDTLKKAKIQIREPILSVVRLLEPEARAKRVRFRVDVSREEPEILGDAFKLEQVWLNLLINAMQAMPAGGEIQISETLQVQEDESWISVTIEDSGVGIPPENLDHLFDPYFTTRSDGTGLGLAIADRIVADHGGTIAVESTPGHGTKMIVRIPAASRAALRSAI